MHWRRQWHPTPVLLPGKSHGRRSLVGYRLWGRKESDTTERLHFQVTTNKTVFKKKIFPVYSSSFRAPEQNLGSDRTKSQGSSARSLVFPQPWSPWAGPRGLCTLFTTPSRHMSQSEHSGRAGPQVKELRPTFPVNKILQRMSMEV